MANGNGAGKLKPRQRFLNRENGIALALALIIIALIIVSSDDAPTFIYQGF